MIRGFASFPVVALLAVVWFATAGAAFAAAPAYGHSAIVQRAGASVFEVDGKPFFVFGAAFFYERLPREAWESSMLRLRNLGINTLDVYVPWNWHELADGDFDFDGRTGPRRDLHEVLRLAKQLDFKIILRPGPVIRNEWRNGGYPAWLLSRPEYGMPLHDLLEGRYPPTATLQNLHSDDAAAEWLHNATHLTYARRWLERVLNECRPVADRVIAVALDDDQGAYIDNQTYPAPNLTAYLAWLRDVVHGVTGPGEPVFINTYQMKVPATSPVWVMGNWYQSDAYALGEHDREQLEFSTALLQTRPQQPAMASEFQAGWLQGPGEAAPRPADPSNTGLAMATMLGLGVRGIVNFPAQDTVNPSGWEAPFANFFYAWDAALGVDGAPSPRAAPTAEIGALVGLLGPQFAAATVRYDAAIAYAGGSVDPRRATNAFFAASALQTMRAQRTCRDAGLSCALVDPSAAGTAGLARYPVLVVPRAGPPAPPFTRQVARALRGYAASGGRVVTGVPTPDAMREALRAARHRAVVEGAPGATFAEDSSGTLAGFLTLPNYGRSARVVSGASVGLSNGERIALPRFTVPKHAALVVPLGLRLQRLDPRFGASDVLSFTDCMPVTASVENGALTLIALEDLGGRITSEARACRVHARLHGVPYDVPAGPDTAAGIRLAPAAISYVAGIPTRAPARAPLPATAPVPLRNDARLYVPAPPVVRRGSALASRFDAYGDGSQAIVLDNGLVRVVVSPDAGARAFVFEDLATQRNAFTTVGAMRDDVAVEPAPSTTDRIAKYTHDFPAGTFNRPYTADVLGSGRHAAARFTYEAPDVIPNGATYARKVSLEPNARSFTVDEGVDFHRSDPIAQRAVSVTSLAVGEVSGTKAQQILAPLAAPFATGTTRHVESGDALGYYDGDTHEFATIAWRAGDVEDATIVERTSSAVVRLTLAPGGIAHLRFGFESASTLEDARIELDRADAAAQSGTQGALLPERTSAGRGEVAERSTRSPQKRLSLRSCGFESHLPYACERPYPLGLESVAF